MQRERQQELAALARALGLPAEATTLLDVALTHPTYAYEHPRRVVAHNQRLEFLGDAVVGLLVGEYLYRQYPDLSEGDLTRMRAAVVCEATLARRAGELGLGRYLLLGRGEEMGGGRERASTLADAFEAVAAAVYLSAGLEAARSFVLGQLEQEVAALTPGAYGDYKTVLQELVQKHYEDNVSYVLLSESGPDHAKTFQAGVSFRGRLLATGRGRSKKEAEQQAARQALERWPATMEKLDG